MNAHPTGEREGQTGGWRSRGGAPRLGKGLKSNFAKVMVRSVIAKWEFFMFQQGTTGSLNCAEKRIVKYLIAKGWTNQNIQALINLERPATINFGRVSGVKNDASIQPCTQVEFEEYNEFKRSFDLKTGLNPFINERLIKSREAMKLAVSVFNNPSFQFRAENFSMLANVAWTYFALEYSVQNDMPTKRKNGKAISLSDFLNNKDCPFPYGVQENLKALVKIRDATEHTVLGPYDEEWVRIFQANCLNYENQLTQYFGTRLTLSSEISFALQFSGLKIGQVNQMSKSSLPEEIKAINAEIFDAMTEDQKDDLEFQFSVVYTTVESSKSKAAFQFVSPKTAEGKAISNVLVKHKPSAITHPYKPGEVVKLVKKQSGKPFTSHQHTLAWKKHNVRPDVKSKNPEKTNLEYCYYNPTFKSHTYNDAWVELLVGEL